MADSAIPTASETQQPPPPVQVRRYNVERSCIRCHQRKIRCDKSTPCSACVKSNTPGSCHYPSFERIKRRSRKQVSTTLVQQVERLEQIVSDTLKQNAHSDEHNRVHRGSSSSPEHTSGDGDPSRGLPNFTGLLIKDGNLVRYVNDHVLSHILEKEDELRQAVTSSHTPSSMDTPGSAARLLSLLHPINHSSYVQRLEELLPTRRRAIQLWKAFVLNVDPIIKLLHIPTMEPIVYAAINESHRATLDIRALMFAIYFSAFTSTLQDSVNLPSGDYSPELEQFKCGLEMNLSQGNFLDQPTMYSLQAMTIFMGAFRCFGSGRSIWTMNGTIIRVAQLMGIHRDGKLFNLSPFDQEMRRRLWWKIVSTDSRALEDQGVWVTGNRSLGDARIPLNINDRDIDPNTKIMPQERNGFTEVTPLVSICHIQVTLETVSQLSLCADLESYSRKLPVAREAVARTRSELEEKFFCDYNPHLPVQRLFRNGTKMVLDKMEWRCQEGLLRHQQQSDPSASQKDSRISTESERLFKKACELLNMSLELVSNEIYAGFIWHSSSYLPYQLLTFVLWRLYVSPTGPSADEAWQTVSRTFSAIDETSILPDKGPRWTILCKLKEKVATLRARSQDRVEMVGLPSANPLDAGVERDMDQQNRDVGDLSLDEGMWDPEDPLFSTDWATFQHNLNMDDIMCP